MLIQFQVTLLSIRAVREQIYIGMRQSQVSDLLQQAHTVAGLTDVDALVLFGGTFCQNFPLDFY